MMSRIGNPIAMSKRVGMIITTFEIANRVLPYLIQK